ncbi:MAG: COX15/CtaA family protein [Gemmatimonadota bacterium]|nr:COX15/CtaA family protein [Gemmatimonadota bacterium]
MESDVFRGLRRLGYAALAMAFAQIVFGAIVRITGSGMGCGDDWPKCAGLWFPPLDRPDLIIEITHRYIALGLSITVLALLSLAFMHRAHPGVRGRHGILLPSAISAVLVVSAALLGAVTVKLGLNPFVIVAHLTIAMTLLATLTVVVFRSAEPGRSEGSRGRASPMSANASSGISDGTTNRAARIAVGVALFTLVMGALTANLPGAASSCGGFPWCRTVSGGGSGLGAHIVHRVAAFLLLGHLWGISRAVRRRGEARPIVTAARFAFWAAVAQILIAAAMIEMQFPPVLRSLHQATGTLVWLAVVILACVSAKTPGHDASALDHRAAA